jgi:hypothetical protein
MARVTNPVEKGEQRKMSSETALIMLLILGFEYVAIYKFLKWYQKRFQRRRVIK